jgi:hypothetical protein
VTSVAEARNDLLSRSALDARGLSSRAIAAAIEAKRLRRVHQGWYVEEHIWDAAFPEKRHLLEVIAAQSRMRGSAAVASQSSAAVLHDLPLFRLTPERVHVSGARLDGHVKKGDVARHDIDIPDEDLTVIDGIPCTSLARTVADMVRLCTRESGLAIADAALRAVAWDDRRRDYDESAAESFRTEVRDRVERMPRARGIRRGREILALADGRAQRPGESVSRLYLLDLGFAAPSLQVRIPARNGGAYFVDLGLDDVGVWGEFDGKGKYLETALRGALTAEQVVLAENEREDWIRGTTGRRIVRWRMRDIASARALGDRLAAFRLYPLVNRPRTGIR